MYDVQRDLIDTVLKAAAIANYYSKELFLGQGVGARQKEDDTPVTEDDIEINQRLKACAERRGIGYIGEEGNGATDTDIILYADSLDGTAAFIRGMNTATIIASIMQVENGYGTPLFSIIHEPKSGYSWIGNAKEATKFRLPNGMCFSQRINRNITKPYRSSICTWPGASHNLPKVKTLVEHSPDFTNQDLGGFGIGAGHIVSGLCDVTAIAATSAMESAAMQLVVAGAGGIAWDLNSKPLDRYKLGIARDKVDFELPDGALFAANKPVAVTIIDHIKAVNQ